MSKHVLPTPVQIIEKKRDGRKLDEDDIKAFVGYITASRDDPKMDDSQIGALLMAIMLNGVDDVEATHLTHHMTHSGRVLKWPNDGTYIDKHSTGGVGDKVSLPLAPILAALGAKVPMISGRGLGFTGGTLDKLESIPGYNASLDTQRFQKVVKEVGAAIVGSTSDVAPADRILYKTRDITGTVWCNGLVYASILSKKAAEGISHLVLDLKCGKDCWLNTQEKAETAGKAFNTIAKGLGMACTSVITNMDRPLGFYVGNALEIIETLDFLKNRQPRNKDLEDLVFTEGAILLASANLCPSVKEAEEKMREVLENGQALEKFREMLVASSVSEENARKLCSNDKNCYECLPMAQFKHEIVSPKAGIIQGIEAVQVGLTCNNLGAGRKTTEDKLKYGVGLHILKHVGDKVEAGETLAILHADASADSTTVERESILKSFVISESQNDFIKDNMIIKIIY